MRIGIAQINTTVGDIEKNCERILAAYRELDGEGADLVLTPELSVCGYPPQDLVFKSRFVPANLAAIAHLQRHLGKAALLVGFVDRNGSGIGRPFRNAAAILEPGREPRIIYKTLLPTYDVFDEARYFEPADQCAPIEIGGAKVGVTICEDIWTGEYLPGRLYEHNPVAQLIEGGAEVIVNLSASPFQLGKPRVRLQMIRELAARHGIPFIYCNAVGGNDQLVFDGNSIVAHPSGTTTLLAGFAEEINLVDLSTVPPTDDTPEKDDMADLHDALVLGLRDYMRKCGFKSCVLGLSGGIDSALTAYIAAEAIGPENVLGVTMPTQFSSSHSVDDSVALAKNLGIRCLNIPIQQSFEAFKAQMAPTFSGLAEDTTEENMQARLRGLTLMSLSNKFGSLLLTTGNKSELAVGYCTLYGDMCGGLAVISDVPKTMVYRLSRHINREREIIPWNTIEKPPSAELRPDQKDQDTLPPYDILDEILRLYVEENLSGDEIVAKGFGDETVRWVIRRVDLNEYKREQAAPGLKVTGRAFGIGRKMPIAQRFIA